MSNYTTKNKLNLSASICLIVLSIGFFLFTSPSMAQWTQPSGVLHYGVTKHSSIRTSHMEIHASIATQEGFVVPSVSRSPLSLRLKVGVNFIKFNIKSLGGRILTGPFISLPFSIEIGWKKNIHQYAPGIGWEFTARPSMHWKWSFGPYIGPYFTPNVSNHNGGMFGIYFGAAYYFLSGLGIFAEVNLEAYLGNNSSMTAGLTAGVIWTYEIIKVVKQKKK